MKKIPLLLLLSGVLLCSWGTIAKCDKERESQTIEISRSGSVIAVENKELSQKCVVKTTKGTTRIPARNWCGYSVISLVRRGIAGWN